MSSALTTPCIYKLRYKHHNVELYYTQWTCDLEMTVIHLEGPPSPLLRLKTLGGHATLWLPDVMEAHIMPVN